MVEGTIELPAPELPESLGLFIRSLAGGAVAILLGNDGVTRMGPLGDDGEGFVCEETVDPQIAFPRHAPFRLLLKHSLVGFHLADILIHCYSVPSRADGRIGVLGSAGRVANPRVWQLPAAHTAPVSGRGRGATGIFAMRSGWPHTICHWSYLKRRTGPPAARDGDRAQPASSSSGTKGAYQAQVGEKTGPSVCGSRRQGTLERVSGCVPALPRVL